jgi:O-antigen ligase
MRMSAWTSPGTWAPLSFGLLSAAVAVIPDTRVRLALLVPIAAVALAWWSVLSANRWLYGFFLCVLLTPPAGVRFAPLLVAVGLLAGAVHLPEWRRAPPGIGIAFGIFLAALTVSSALGTLYSGADVGLESIARVGLFAIGVYVFFYACAGPRESGYNPMRFAGFLFFAGVATALFGCADFYFHFPAPEGFGQQFVWLDEGVFRRAQGLFYEASTFGNLCAFFLVMIAVAVSRIAKTGTRLVLASGGIVFGAALMLSYSRGSVANVVAACLALAILRRMRAWRAVALAAVTAAVSIVAVHALWPAFSVSYWTRIAGSLQYFWYSPDGVLSGRVGNWRLLIDFLLREPWHVLFGIGYKTLPYTGIAGTPVIADNTYLGLAVETGVVGLAAFLALNVYILKAALRAARDSNRRAVFFGEWIFCFWIGEMVQMLSGDLITYWRVLPVYFWVLGTAIRETQDSA